MEDNNAYVGAYSAPQEGADGAAPADFDTIREQDTTPPGYDKTLAEDGADFDFEGGDGEDILTNENDTDENEFDGNGDAGNRSETPSGDPVVTIKFNHQKENITADEAAVRIQKYMKLDPVISKLKYMAAASDQSVEGLVEAFYHLNERVLMNHLADKFGNDAELIGEALQVHRMKHDTAYKEMLEMEERVEQSEQDDLHKRLAGDFLELKAEFPEFGDFSRVPKDVVLGAVKKDISLLDSYLRFQHAENKKSNAAISARQAAAKTSTGSVRSADLDGDSPEVSAMMKGIWG